MIITITDAPFTTGLTRWAGKLPDKHCHCRLECCMEKANGTP